MRTRRSIDYTSLLSIIPLLVLSAVSFGLLWLVTLPLGENQIWFFIGWPFTLPLLFVRPIERKMMWSWYGFRKMNEQEMADIYPSWKNVLERSGRNPKDFILAAQDIPHINAAAAGYHTVAASTGAIQDLPPEYMEAILAHELGHHVGFHPVILTISAWMMFPIQIFGKIAYLLFKMNLYILRFANFVGFYPLASALIFVAYIIRFVIATVFFPVRVGQFLTLSIGRLSELKADQTAVELGYGEDLKELFRAFAEVNPDDSTWTQRMTSSHPPMEKRMDKIQKRMERT